MKSPCSARGRLTLGRLVHADQCYDATVTVNSFLSIQGTPLLNKNLSVLGNNDFRTSQRDASVKATQMIDLSFNYQHRAQELWRLLRKPNALFVVSSDMTAPNLCLAPTKSQSSQLMQTRQTSPPVPPPDELDETCVVFDSDPFAPL